MTEGDLFRGNREGKGRTGMKKLLLFDLDGTLLRSDKSVSEKTLDTLEKCRECGCIIGISTSRSEQNCISIFNRFHPDVLITSGGALVKKENVHLYKAVFSPERTNAILAEARRICGWDCEITVDTIENHFWNYKIDPKALDQSWGDSVWTNYADFREEALKICVEIPDERNAETLKEILSDCDCIRFSDGCWYKFTKKGVTKENAIHVVCDSYEIGLPEVAAFGDDYADIEMLKMAGVGVAMGNAIPEVKAIADIVIGSNDEDGIAEYLEESFLI